MNRQSRLAALEQSSTGGVYLHLPKSGDDHAAIWAAAPWGRKVLRIVRFPGFNGGAVDAFKAAKPEGAQ